MGEVYDQREALCIPKDWPLGHEPQNGRFPDPADLDATIAAERKLWTTEFRVAVLMALKRIEERLERLEGRNAQVQKRP